MAYSSRTTLGATRARQGRFGRHMIWVLLFGTLLAAAGMFAAWTWKAPDMAASQAATNQQAATHPLNAPEPAARGNPAPAEPANP
ncbi:MAG: hypothetical protein JWQ29_127 [Phenylobacterium sp.]|nr:hypothetical protein [Phenylobacterium sp.]